jgi:hypothetical protein
VGDASDLANQLTTVLESPELQRSMGRHNFAAGLEMTIGSVVRNYLRWFELNKYKKELSKGIAAPAEQASLRSLFSHPTQQMPTIANGNSPHGSDRHGREAAEGAQTVDLVDPLT